MIINFSDEPIIYNKDSIFLAGPILRNSFYKDSWHKQACDYLESIGYDGVVYVPMYKDKVAAVDLVTQASWEREGLKNAGAIVFFLCRTMPDMPGLTTNCEFGRYLVLRPDNVLLCSPQWACKNSYLEWQYKEDKPDAPIYRTLEEVLDAAVIKSRSVAVAWHDKLLRSNQLAAHK